MQPEAGHLESFGVTFVPVLLKSKVEEKKHRCPQGDKQTKGNLFKPKIDLEIQVGFHRAKKPLSSCCLSKKATKAKWLSHLF